MLKNWKWPVLLAAAVLLAVSAWWLSRSGDEAPKYRLARVERGPLTATVASTGTLNPVTSVQVGTQVSGQIKELFVDFNSPVKEGQLIARIDPETFQYRMRQAEADLEAARSSLNRSRVAQANSQRDLQRTKELVARNFVSPAELDRAQSTFDLAAAEVRTAEAVVQQREAQLASARIDLSRTDIRAPVDGVVIKRSVDVGQTVAASLQAPELFIIAKDLRDMQVETSIDEADVGRIRVGQRATFTVDAFPGRTFSGEVRTVRKAPQNAQNVVTYIAIVSAINDRGELLPGMTANVRIVTDTRESVLKVQNGALRFRPAGIASDASKASPEPGEKMVAKSAGDGGALAQFRERLVTELKLDAGQQQRLEPVFAEMRGKFDAVRDLPEEARAKALSALQSELRAKIDDVLRPDQKARYAEIAAEFAGRSGGQSARGRLWVADGDRPRALDVRVGLSDGAMAEVSGDGVTEGLEVIVGTQGSATNAPAQKGAPPRMFF